MKRVMIFVFLSYLVSCKNNDVTNEELNKILSTSLIEYNDTRNKDVLKKSYSFLSRNKDYREEGLQKDFFISATGVMMNLEKYDELENLLKTNHNIDEYTKMKILNDLGFMKFKSKDKKKAKEYLKKNQLMILNKIKRNPKDTLLYSEYFGIRTLLVGKEKSLLEVDSIFSNQSQYREIFKDMINDYSNDPKSGMGW